MKDQFEFCGIKSPKRKELTQIFNRRLAGSKEFFIQKAIGWALREYSKTDGNGVQKFIQSNSLAPLSVRGGMRLIQ